MVDIGFNQKRRLSFLWAILTARTASEKLIADQGKY